MAGIENTKIQPQLYMLSTAAMSTRIFVVQHNQVNEVPSDANRVYVVNGQKFGQPRFRIKKRKGGSVIPDSDAFWFVKDATTGKTTLHCIVEAFRPEPDVFPFTIRNQQIEVQFQAGGKTVKQPMQITASPLINDINILQDLVAETEITPETVLDLVRDLTKSNLTVTFQLTIRSELWFQVMTSGPAEQARPRVGIGASDMTDLTQLKVRHMSAAGRPFLAQAQILARTDHIIAGDRVRARPWVRDHRTGSGPIVRDHRNQTPGPRPEPQPQPGPPAKIDLMHVEMVQYTKKDQSVFGELLADTEVNGFEWTSVNLIKENGLQYPIYYKPTAQPDVFFFLPQVFRIKAKENNGEPKISITMVAGDDPNDTAKYRINIGITLLPYYNPKAKKDLYRTLNTATTGLVKFCELSLGGYKSVRFELRDAFAGENAVFRGKIKEAIETIDPITGFTLSVECSLESFDFFKRELSDGEWVVGDAVFELVTDGDNPDQTKSVRIPVELDIRKLVGIPVGIETVDSGQPDVPITGFRIHNTNTFPIVVGGAELTLLSKIGSTVYDADYDIGVQRAWPIEIPEQGSQEVLLRQEDIMDLTERFWTELSCEPFGLSLNTTPEQVLSKVIDYATGDPQIWQLEVNCPLFERWNELDDATLAPFRQVHQVIVEIKNEAGEVSAVQLSKTKPVDSIKMARSIKQILNSQQLSSRKYMYRVGTVYVLDPTFWTDWTEPETTSGNFLIIRPQKLTV
ncbi:hypothetical protein [Larkinella soli]|uniref:hypothetical protein n=1 Tax=Larkinella soli TaxID=1770527 RepID=UPI000FFB4C50|nr:hypothetical protein [Larkinella soli]